MWICVKAVEREIEILGTADTKEEILEIMYDDLAGIYPDVNTLNEDIEYDQAEYCDSDMYAWSNYKNVNSDWKCFWV